jgi:hypothetical protein
MLPASVYSKKQLLASNRLSDFGFSQNNAMNETDRQVVLSQLEEGIKLSENYYLRRFPAQVHLQMHGSTGIQLSETAALAMAYQVRNNCEAEQLVSRQMEWISGANPFSSSLMYGEGYDYNTLFSASLGNIVGALPVGMDCMKNDEPHWYASNHMTPKEVWVVPTGRYLWSAAYISTPALVTGSVATGPGAVITLNGPEGEPEKTIKTDRDGNFSVVLNPGSWQFRYKDLVMNLKVLRGCDYHINLDPANNLDFTAAIYRNTEAAGTLEVRIMAEGLGNHSFQLLNSTGTPDTSTLQVELQPGEKQEVSFNVSQLPGDTPWVMVVVPDGDYHKRHELTGDF